MRVLVGWDDPVESETINLILNVEETNAHICDGGEEFDRLASEQDWDVVLMSTSFPTEKRTPAQTGIRA